MARVWMNHWFSTAYNIINLIRKAFPDIEIIGSNEHPYSPIMNVCDEWYQEPVIKGEQYVSYWCSSAEEISPQSGELPTCPVPGTFHYTYSGTDL